MCASVRPKVLDAVDSVIGDTIEGVVRLKHRWRLTRVGWRDALGATPGVWSERGASPRPGCDVHLLVDGAEAFASMAEAIGSARESVWVAGWFINPDFELIRGPNGQSVGALLAAAAEHLDVRVLLWAGSPVRLFQPNRSQAQHAAAELTRGTQIRCELDAHERLLHCHHEKLMIVDGEIAYVGGIDMTDLNTDRYDTVAHPARRRSGWHDVGTRMTGPVVADVAAHFAMRWHEVTGEALELKAPPPVTGEYTVQLTRTVPERQYDALPRGEFSILESYIRAIRAARHVIYIENQFLWSPEITAALAEKLRTPPGPGFRVLIVLPSKAHAGQDDTLGQAGQLVAADRHDRLLIATLRALSGERDDPLYVHSKVAVIDDRWVTVGSANLNAHSLFNDSEVNIVSDSPSLARSTRIRLWAEHLEVERGEIEGRDAAAVIDELWAPICTDQLHRQRTGQPPTHRLLAMSHVSRRSRRLLGPLDGLLSDA